MSIFVSWSGHRSKQVATLLRDWLPNVIQALQVWMSDKDIDAGTRGVNEIFSNLVSATAGVICVTKENTESPWLLFESGALSKQISDKTWVCPYLLDMRPTDIQQPLAEFQAVSANEEGTRKLIKSINKSLGGAALADELIAKAFEKWWPELKDNLARVAAESPAEKKKQVDSEVTIEILASVREIMRRLDEERSNPERDFLTRRLLLERQERFKLQAELELSKAALLSEQAENIKKSIAEFRVSQTE